MHRWHERPGSRTIIVEGSPPALLYLYSNLHLVHHRHPSVPWYRLPAPYRERWEERLAMNGGYLLSGYRALVRDHALSGNETVVHPSTGAEADR